MFKLVTTPKSTNSLFDLFMEDAMISSFLNDNATKPVNFADEDAKAYHLTIQAAGFKKEDITINVEGRKLKITGTSSHEKVDRTLNYHFVPPKAISTSNIEAHLEDGILSITVPISWPAMFKQAIPPNKLT